MNKKVLPSNEGTLLFFNVIDLPIAVNMIRRNILIYYFYQGQLFLQTLSKNYRNLYMVDHETLALKTCITLHDIVGKSSTLFSDGNRLGSVFKTDEV